MKSIATTVTPPRVFCLFALSMLFFAAVCSLNVIRTRAEVKTGQFPKEKIARQTFSATDGHKISLESMRGKIVVMQFLGTWCGYSKRQVGAINKMLANGNPADLSVVGMTVKDARSNSQAVRQFISEQKIGYSVVSELEDKYFVDFVNSTDVSVPQTVIYGRDGRVLAHFKGFNGQVEAGIQALLKSEMAIKQ